MCNNKNDNYCYLLAKKFGERECIVLKQNYGKELSELSRFLNFECAYKGVEIIVVGKKYEMCGEYKPYVFIENKEEFIEKALKMCE